MRVAAVLERGSGEVEKGMISQHPEGAGGERQRSSSHTQEGPTQSWMAGEPECHLRAPDPHMKAHKVTLSLPTLVLIHMHLVCS